MRGNQKNKNYKIKWSPKFAYVIGLLVTDGNLSKDGRHINFTSQDIQLIETFCKCINLSNIKIGMKSSGFTDRKCPWIQFSNSALYKYLLKIGLMPNKTKAIGEIKMPDRYFFDFLRGHFDGDGSCYSYWDRRWRSSFMFYTAFISVSKKHILWIRSKLEKLIGIEGSLGSVNRPKRAPLYQLKYAKKESKILLPKMYYKKRLPCLQRKYKKLKKILEIDEKENKSKIMSGYLNGRVMESVDIYA